MWCCCSAELVWWWFRASSVLSIQSVPLGIAQMCPLLQGLCYSNAQGNSKWQMIIILADTIYIPTPWTLYFLGQISLSSINF